MGLIRWAAKKAFTVPLSVGTAGVSTVVIGLKKKSKRELLKEQNKLIGEQMGAPISVSTLPSTPVPLASVSTADELTKLADLRDRGALTQEEFQAQKVKLLRARPSALADDRWDLPRSDVPDYLLPSDVTRSRIPQVTAGVCPACGSTDLLYGDLAGVGGKICKNCEWQPASDREGRRFAAEEKVLRRAGGPDTK